jgi:hypothetical protein
MDSDIRDIPGDELWKDRLVSLEDAKVCLTAIYGGVYEYGGMNGIVSVDERLAGNIAIIKKINAELQRRRDEAMQ